MASHAGKDNTLEAAKQAWMVLQQRWLAWLHSNSSTAGCYCSKQAMRGTLAAADWFQLFLVDLTVLQQVLSVPVLWIQVISPLRCTAQMGRLEYTQILHA